jgi:hypothetical protein
MTGTSTRWILLLLIVAAMIVIVLLLYTRPWLSAAATQQTSSLITNPQALVLDLHYSAAAAINKLSLSNLRLTDQRVPALIPGRGEWTVELVTNGGERVSYFALANPGRVEHVDAIGTPGASAQTYRPDFDWTVTIPLDLLAGLKPDSVLRVYDKDGVAMAALNLNLPPGGLPSAVTTDAALVPALGSTPTATATSLQTPSPFSSATP